MKRSLLTDGNGIPIGITVAGANRHDMKLARQTLSSVLVEEMPDEKNLCLDKGYDYEKVRKIVEEFGYTAHVRTRGEERQLKEHLPGYRARRWVVERTHSWMNRFRRILIRWEKKLRNYLAMLHLACAWITCRRAGVLG